MIKDGKKRTTDFFNRLGYDYVAGTKKEYRSIYEHTTSIIRPYLRGRVLDLGSGGVDQFDDLVTESWVCYDISMGLLSIHETSDVRMAVCGESAKLPFKDQSFDVVVISFALHHFAQDTVAITFRYLRDTFIEVARVCCPGGRLIVVENTILPVLEWLQGRIYPFVRSALYLFDRPPVFLVSEERIRKLLGDAGFRVQRRFSFKSAAKVLVFPGTIPKRLNPISFSTLIVKRA